MSEEQEVAPEEDSPDEVVVAVDREGYEDINETEEVAPLHSSVTSYGADFPVDSLVNRLNNNDIVVPSFYPELGDPDAGIVGFQRDYVWSKSQADRFVESLLLGFPVPGIFLVQGTDGVYLVLDGQQRLKTLQAFYRGSLRDRTFRLQSVQEQFKGKTYDTLDIDSRRQLDNSIIHATIVKPDDPSGDQSGIYHVFERLNTGGTLLQPQEIRVALYHGDLITLIRELNENEDWRTLVGAVSRRLKDQELILRFFAMRSPERTYEAPMKEFLNQYAEWNRQLNHETGEVLKDHFTSTVAKINGVLGASAFRPARAVNAAVVDSLMTAIDAGNSENRLKDDDALRSGFERLMADDEYRSAIEKATAREENVAIRKERAVSYLLD